jgi:hypothetical protein
MADSRPTKEEIRRRRDSAFSLNLGIDPDDSTKAAISRRDGLYIITTAKIIRINLPDDIDPELQHEDAPTTQTLLVDQGSRTPIVARTVIQLEDFLQLVPYLEDEKKRLRDIAWEVMLSLTAYDRIIKRIRSAIDAKRAEILPDYEKYSSGFSPPPVPGVEGLEIEFRSAVLTANHTLNAMSELFCEVFREKFTKFQRGRYDKIIEWSVEQFGKDDILSAMLADDHRWINLWGEVRNALEHPTDIYFVKVNNFRLLADRTIQLPTWQLQHPSLLDAFRPQQLIETLEIHRGNILTFFENLLVVLFSKVTSPGVAIEVVDIQEKDRNPDCPKRYECTLVLQ